MHSGIEVRPVGPADIGRLVELCLVARRESWTGPQLSTSDPEAIGRQVGALTALPGAIVLVAVADEQVVGLLFGRLLLPNLLTDEASFVVEAVYVHPGHRRRGIGHGLMLTAVEQAVDSGALQVYAAPIPGARGMQRFFVRLGFGPAAAYRVMGATALLRQLVGEWGPGRRLGSRGLEDLIARRRQARVGSGSTVARR